MICAAFNQPQPHVYGVAFAYAINTQHLTQRQCSIIAACAIVVLQQRGATAEVLHTRAVAALVVAEAGGFQHLKVAGQRPVGHLDLVNIVEQQAAIFASENFGHQSTPIRLTLTLLRPGLTDVTCGCSS